jgi:hypothetical protein
MMVISSRRGADVWRNSPYQLRVSPGLKGGPRGWHGLSIRIALVNLVTKTCWLLLGVALVSAAEGGASRPGQSQSQSR